MTVLHKLPIRENPLIANIAAVMPAISKTELLRPGNELFDHIAGLARKEIKELWKPIGKMQTAKSKLKKIQSDLETGESNLKKLQDQFQKAFGVERPFFEKSIDAQKSINRTLEESRQELRKKFEKIWGKGRQFKSTVRPEIEKLLQDFPQAQLIDLDCLQHFKLPNGLPALGLFRIYNPYTKYLILSSDYRARIATSDYEYGFSNNVAGFLDGLHSDCLAQIKNDVCMATGLKVGKVDVPDSTGTAEAIYLATSFESLGGAIPTEAREIINKASESKSFEGIYLLAEITKWELRCERMSGTSRLEIQEIPAGTYRDPLIIGVKKIHGFSLPFVIGHFDTTPLEALLKDEFCVKS